MALDNQKQDLSKVQANRMSIKTEASPFKKLQNHALIETAKVLVQKERALTLQVLDCLREIETRRLHLVRGYSSLHEFAVKELGYSDGSAFRRIQAMRLTRELPEVKKSIQEGKLSLSTASQAQRFFYSQKITKTEDKKVLLEKIENKSARETECFFAGLAPETIRPEKERILSETHIEMRIMIDQKLRAKLEKIKNLISHKHPNPSYAELFNYLSDLALEKLDPEIKHQKTAKAQGAKVQKSLDQSPDRGQPARTSAGKLGFGKNSAELDYSQKLNSVANRSNQLSNTNSYELDQTQIESTQTQATLKPATQIEGEGKALKKGRYIPKLLRSTQIENKMHKRSRYIPELLRRKIWVRDQGECQFIDPITKRKCGSKKYLQIEHKRPFAAGGEHSENNLTLLCSSHNLFQAQKFYGAAKLKNILDKR